MISFIKRNEYVQYLLYKNTKSRAFFKLYGIVINELKVCFSQFFTFRYPASSLFRSIGFFLQTLNRLLLGRSTSLSYAFTAEDRIIESLIKPIITQKGFYVDIGCNEPVFISNTFLFYRRGWRGLCVDANEQLIKKFKRMRPRDTAVCALISDKTETTTFSYSENPVLSSADASSTEQFLKEGIKLKAQINVPSQTLTSLFTTYGVPREFDFLSIDIEGNDLKALYGLDLNQYRPKLIVFEWEEFQLNAAQKEEIVEYLQKYNYTFVGYILTNAYFMIK